MITLQPQIKKALHKEFNFNVVKSIESAYKAGHYSYDLNSKKDQLEIFKQLVHCQSYLRRYKNNHVECVKRQTNCPKDYYSFGNYHCKDLTNYTRFNIGCIIKYLIREGRKINNSKNNEIQKCFNYLQIEFSFLHELKKLHVDKQDLTY